MERTVLMLRAEQRKKIAKLAAQEHISTAEVHRRAIDAYDPDLMNNEELEQLAETVIKSNAMAMQALKDARKAIKQTVASMTKKKVSHGN